MRCAVISRYDRVPDQSAKYSEKKENRKKADED